MWKIVQEQEFMQVIAGQFPKIGCKNTWAEKKMRKEYFW